MIIEVFTFLSLFIISILLHEAGHIMTYKSITGYNPRIINNNPLAFEISLRGVFKKKDQFIIAFNGILAGLFVVLLSFGTLTTGGSLLLLFWYLVGCRHDIRYIWGLRK